MNRDGTADVLASAMTEFSERGVEAARLSHIASAAGISLPTLEQEFGTRETLFRIALREAANRHVARACKELPPGSPAEQLRNFCGRAWEILHTPGYAELYRLWVTEVPRYPDLARFYAEEVYAPIHAMLEGIIERGIRLGQFHPLSPRATARVIMAALVSQAFWCNHADAFGSAIVGGCNRVVAETMSILLGGLQSSQPESTS